MTLAQLSILWYLIFGISIVLVSHGETGTSVAALLAVGGVLIFTFRPQFKQIRRKLIKTVLFPCILLIAGVGLLMVSASVLEKYQEQEWEPISEIMSVEIYDGATLSRSGTLEGWVKNNSQRTLLELSLDIVVLNSREDVTFRGDISIVCKVPPGQAKFVRVCGAVPYDSLPDKYTWNILHIVAWGYGNLDDLLGFIPDEPQGMNLPEGFVLEEPQGITREIVPKPSEIDTSLDEAFGAAKNGVTTAK